MQTPPNTPKSHLLRAGNARILGVLLGLAALIAAGVAAYAVWSLLQTPIPQTPTVPDEPEPAGGMAQTESIEEILGAVQVYVRNEQFPQALTVLENAAAQYPGDQEIRLALGDLYMMRQRFSEAYDQYQAGIEIGPPTAAAEFTAGTLANMLERPEAAEMHYNRAMKLDPSNPDTPVYLAAIHMKANRLEDAKLSLALAGKLAPESARVFAMRSEIAMRENKLVIALEQIRRARALDPQNLGWLLQEARVLKRDRNPEGALELLTALPQASLEEPDTAYLLAECFGAIGKPAEAASRLMDLAQKRRADPRLAFEVALWLQRAGEQEEAVQWANRAAMMGHERARGWLDSLPTDQP